METPELIKLTLIVTGVAEKISIGITLRIVALLVLPQTPEIDFAEDTPDNDAQKCGREH